MKQLLYAVILLLVTGCSQIIGPSNDSQHHYFTQFYPATGSDINDTHKHPIIFLFGGSEGGIWRDQAHETSDLQHLGYHVVHMGYFGMEGLPQSLSRIDLGAFQKVLDHYKQLPNVDRNGIALLGVSKGGELALLLASLYPDIHTVVAVVPSHVAFQASDVTLSQHASWRYNGKEVPFVPYPRLSWATLKGVLDGEHYRQMHLEALKNREAVERARIKVENIHGNIYLLSAKYDQMWPSTQMCEAIVERLKQKGFPYTYKHVIFESNHFVLDHQKAWQTILSWLREEKRRYRHLHR